MTSREIEQWLRDRVGQAIFLPAPELDPSLPFTEYGLDSLTLFTMTGELAEQLGCDLPSSLVWQHPSIAELSAFLAANLGEFAFAPAPAPAHEQLRPLSSGQAHLWRYGRAEETRLHFQTIRPFLVHGPLDHSTVQRTLDEIVRRHESLRTTLAEVEGVPGQRIHPPSPAYLTVVDLSGKRDPLSASERLLSEIKEDPLDLEHGPLFRTHLIRLGHEQHRLVFQLHHILYDAQSFAILYGEFAKIYTAYQQGEASPLPELSLQMADFAEWESRRLDPAGELFRKEVRWWKEYWRQPEPPTGKFSFERPVPFPGMPPEECKLARPVPRRWRIALEECSRSLGTTPYVIYFALFALTLHQHSSSKRFVLSTYVSTRSARGVDAILGYFVNQLDLRISLAEVSTWSELVRRMRETIDQVSAHQEVLRSRWMEALSQDGPPIPQPCATFQYIKNKHSWDIPLLQVEPFPKTVPPRRIPSGLLLNILERGDEMLVSFTFDGVRYDPLKMDLFIRRYLWNLKQLVRHPNQGFPSRSFPGWIQWLLQRIAGTCA